MRFNLMNKRAGIGLLQIFILMLSVVSFSYLVSGAGLLASFGDMWGAEDWTMICGKVAAGENGMDLSAVKSLSATELGNKYYKECDVDYPVGISPQTTALNKQCKAEAIDKINAGISGDKVTSKSVVDKCKNNKGALSNLDHADFLEGAQENLGEGLDSNVKDEIEGRIKNSQGDGKFLEEFNSDGNSGIRKQYLKDIGADYEGSGSVPKVEYGDNGQYTFDTNKAPGRLKLDAGKLTENGINKFNIKDMGKNIEIETRSLEEGANIFKTGSGDKSWLDFENIKGVKVDDYEFSGLDKLRLRKDGFQFSGDGARVSGPDSLKIVNSGGDGVSVGINGNSPSLLEGDSSTFKINSNNELTNFESFGSSRVTYEGSVADRAVFDFTNANGEFFEGGSGLRIMGSNGEEAVFSKNWINNAENLGSTMEDIKIAKLLNGDKSYTFTNTPEGGVTVDVTPASSAAIQPAVRTGGIGSAEVPSPVKPPVKLPVKPPVKPLPEISKTPKSILSSPSTLLTLVSLAGGVSSLIALFKDKDD